jgi:hypothetical protein
MKKGSIKVLWLCIVLGLVISLAIAGCDGGGDGGGPVDGGVPGDDLSEIAILSEEIAPSTVIDACALFVRIKNLTNQLLSLGLLYNAFDNAGVGIGFTSITGLLPANATETFEQFWLTSGGSTIDDCADIDTFELDPSSVIVGG